MVETVKDIIAPPMGESVTEATIARWLKKPGDAVVLDETLVELETDKVTLEVNASTAGFLKDIKFNVGDTITVGDVLGSISTSQQAGVTAAPQPAVVVPASASATAGPAARKIATENNVALQTVPASGPGGRVTKGDVLQFIDQPKVATPVRDAAPTEERVRMTRLRQRIAERLKMAQNTAAILTTFNEIDMSGVMAIRDKYKDVFEKKHGVKLGFMSLFVKACVQALKEIPAVNAEIQGDELIYKNHYDIGVAVGTPQGLVVPILRDADVLSFAEVEKEIAALGLKARNGKLTMEDMSGGTFTISNGGTYGSLLSTPILNPPQSGILGMHKIEKRAVVVNDQIVIRPMMYVALSYDHRVIDGKEAVTFLVRVKECLEDPQRLLFGM